MKLLELREKLNKLRIKKEKPHEIRLVKKEIARFLTEQNIKENSGGK